MHFADISVNFSTNFMKVYDPVTLGQRAAPDYANGGEKTNTYWTKRISEGRNEHEVYLWDNDRT